MSSVSLSFRTYGFSFTCYTKRYLYAVDVFGIFFLQGGNKLGEGEREHDLIQPLDDLCKEYDHDTARQAVETMLRLAK